MFFDVADAPSLYAQLRDGAIPQLRALTTAQAERPVAACPGWTVTNVMAHVSGLVAETLAGVPLPRGSDEATARQVGDRRELSLAQLCDEWVGNSDAFHSFGEQDPAYVAALTSDLVVHLLDIAEALDLPIDIDPMAIQLVAARYGQALRDRATDAGIALALSLDGVSAGARSDDAEKSSSAVLELRASSHDFLRAVTGRRSGAQVRAMDWTGDPEPMLATAWSQYGPLVD